MKKLKFSFHCWLDSFPAYPDDSSCHWVAAKDFGSSLRAVSKDSQKVEWKEKVQKQQGKWRLWEDGADNLKAASKANQASLAEPRDNLLLHASCIDAVVYA